MKVPTLFSLKETLLGALAAVIFVAIIPFAVIMSDSPSEAFARAHPDSLVEWENVGWATSRAPVVGGWLVKVHGDVMVFVPDSEHRWTR